MADFLFVPDSAGDTPLYEQIYRRFVSEIQSGSLAAGEKVPSKRRLCAHLGVSMSTVETAYSLLVAEGYLDSRPRSGYRVSPLLPLEAPAAEAPALPVSPPPAPPLADPFSTGAVDTSVFPYSSWARLTRDAVYQNPDLLQRGDPQGDRELRQVLCHFLREYRGVVCSPEQLVIGAGMEYLLDLVLQLLPREAVYALEDPGYRSTYRAVANQGLQVVPIPVDGQGMDCAALEASGATVAYVTPSHQFPLGVTMPAGRRTQLLRWAYARPDRYLIEDDYDSEFRYTSRPIPAMQGLDRRGRVVYVGTFSRSIAPSIRVAYLILPPALLARYRAQFSYAASTVSRFEQQVLCRFIGDGLYARHLRRVGGLYRARRGQLLELLSAIPHSAVTGSEAGLHLLLHLPGRDEGALCARAAAEFGLKLRGLGEFCRAAPPRQAALVLGFAGLDRERLEAYGPALLSLCRQEPSALDKS